MNECFLTNIKDGAEILVVSFSSKGIHDSDKVVPEMVKTYDALGYSQLHVLDLDKTWFQRQELIDATIREIELTKELAKTKKVVFTGHSMGAFGALMFSMYVDCDLVVAIAPQVDLNICANDSRWSKPLSKVKPFVYPHVRELREDILYKILYGDAFDKSQIDLIKKTDNIQVINEVNNHLVGSHWRRNKILKERLQELIE